MFPSLRSVAPSATLALLAFALAACEPGHGFNLNPNDPPAVSLTSGPVDTVSAPQSWLVDIAWNATDADGHIDHVEYAIDPPHLKQALLAQAETAWVQTHESHVVARFRASHPDSLGPGATASEFHVFVLRAVDDRGGRSANVVRAFYAYTVAPDVKFTRPVPNQFFPPTVPVPFRAEWQGHDADGTGSGQPAAYRTRLLSFNDYGNVAYLSDPDSLLREGEAEGWTGWQTLPGESTGIVITPTELPPGQSALLAVVAVDEAGATTPYLDLGQNFLQFSCAPPNTTGPRLHIWSSLFDYSYETGGYLLDPSREIPIEVPINRALSFSWDGVPAPGRHLVSTRWMLDGDVGDETPRIGPDDLSHWSAPIPPPGHAEFTITTSGLHRLYVELTDDFGEKSLGIVRITAIEVELERELLVVNDTRPEVDKFRSPGTLDPYTQAWPTKTELDTFLFARGGYPWRQTKNPTTGVISTPGLLAGYAFDTLGTRRGLENAANGVPLDMLGRYRHVIWLVDDRGALNNEADDQNLRPTAALRAMPKPGVVSTLAEYIQAGGQVWLAGGGAAYTSLAAWDRPTNNTGGIAVFTAADDELGPGRPMY